MAKRLRRQFLEEHEGEEVFECYFCSEDVERDEVVVRHAETGDEDSEVVPAHRRCHNENTSPL
jgi:hypothetical protein